MGRAQPVVLQKALATAPVGDFIVRHSDSNERMLVLMVKVGPSKG